MFFIVAEISQPGFMTRAAHRRVMKRVHRVLMLIIRTELIPKHFRNVPETRPGGAYGYEKRTPAWQIRKAKKLGFVRPNVWTGETQRRAARGKITATRSRGRLFAKLKFQDVERVEEIESITRQEKQMLFAAAKRLYLRFAEQEARRKQKPRKRKRKRRK